MSTNNQLLNFVGGIALGAALGILLAPDSGAVTRKKLIKKSNQLTDDLSEKIAEFSQLLNSFVAKTSEAPIIEDAKALIEQINESIVKEV